MRASDVRIQLRLFTIISAFALGACANQIQSVRVWDADYMDADHRDAPKHFVAERIKLGMTISDAAELLKNSGISCQHIQKSDDLKCTSLSLQNTPDYLYEVFWTVRIRSSPTGTVVRVLVDRSVLNL